MWQLMSIFFNPNQEAGIKLGGFSDAWSDNAIWYVENP